jgi:hypothetical protein
MTHNGSGAIRAALVTSCLPGAGVDLMRRSLA